MNSTNNRLAANIRSLRKAYGETQEQFGEAIGGFAKNAISYYETGQREPNKETLTAIAKHFMVSVEDLIHSDLTTIGKITIDKDAFWKNVDIVLPVVSSDRAMQNDSFKKAYTAHRAFYDQLHQVSLDGIDKIDICLDGYMEAMEDDSIEAEAAANILALCFLLMMSMKTVPVVMKNKPAALWQIATKDEKTKKMIENIDPSFEKDAKEALSEIDDETKEMLTEMLIAIKRSKEWPDLADYYLALQYIWNLVDNDLDFGFNQRIGIEMMSAFVSVENIYAARFLKFNFDSLRGVSSQPVDDN